MRKFTILNVNINIYLKISPQITIIKHGDVKSKFIFIAI
jgi:hypothetical protein